MRSAKSPALPEATRQWARDSFGRDFRKPDLLVQALTHPSAPGTSYERLEFLGDRVLGLVMAHWLHERYPLDSEGLLARRFAELVRREVCASVAQQLGAAAHIRIDRAAAHTGLAANETILADVCEALIGALYLDGGLAATRAFIRRAWQAVVESGPAEAPKDDKSALQEWAQARGRPLPAYSVIAREGPDHAPRFMIEVTVAGEDPVRAEGSTKQDAQKKAAAAMLEIVRCRHD